MQKLIHGFTSRVMLLIVNSAALITLYFTDNSQVIKITEDSLSVFMMIGKSHIFMSIFAILSLTDYFQDVQFFLIFEKKINLLDRYLIDKLRGRTMITVISETDITALKKEISGYSKLLDFYKSDWFGKKFIIPFLMGKNKILVLDSDTLFVNKPKEIIRWTKTKTDYSFYIEDSDNYVLLSKSEARSILKNRPKLDKLNSGLIAINLKQYRIKNNLPQINQYLDQTLKILNERKKQIYDDKEIFDIAGPFLEQTLYRLTLELIKTYRLNNKYFVFGKHIYGRQRIGKPVFLHFVSDLGKKSMYRYLFFSLIEFAYETFFKKSKIKKPWYRYSDNYCFRCWHRL